MPAAPVATLEARLAHLRDLVQAEKARHASAVHAETRRHLIRLAEYAADEARLENELEAARKSSRLQPHRGARTMVGTMSTPAISDKLLPRPPRRRQQRPAPAGRQGRAPLFGVNWVGSATSNPHRFAQALLEHDPPIKIKDWAAQNGFKRETVNGWIAPLDNPDGTANKASRRIPPAAARLIAKQFPKVPATLETWPQGFLPE